MKASVIAALLAPMGALARPCPEAVNNAAAAQQGSQQGGQQAAAAGDSLNALFKAKGKLYYGNIADPGTLGNPQNTQVLKDQFGQLTPENSMKASPRPSPPVVFDILV